MMVRFFALVIPVFFGSTILLPIPVTVPATNHLTNTIPYPAELLTNLTLNITNNYYSYPSKYN